MLAACLPACAVPAGPGRTLGAPPFAAGGGEAAVLRGSCRAGPEDALFTAARLGLDVRSCRAGPEDVPPAEDAAVAGGMFLPGRGVGAGGLWVLRVGFPAEPG